MTIEKTIGYMILNEVAKQLEADLIDGVEETDKALVGTIVEGPLLDDPDYEESRISIQLFENDPFNFDANWDWVDEPVESEIELGGGMTWYRRYMLEARALLINTAENRDDARRIASILRMRIEKSLMSVDFSSVESDGEFVSAPIFNKNIRSKLLQSGGPESWDFIIHARFEVKTTKYY